jgi:glycosyltransferase involved in cell wall biosynthesis
METGYLIPEDSIQDAVRVIESIAHDQAEHLKRGARARLACAELEWPRVAMRYGELYEVLAENAS